MKKIIVLVFLGLVLIMTGCTQQAPPIEPEVEEPTSQPTSLCTDPPTATAIGRDVYPIDPKYDGLNFLGQLFTAYNCSPERMSKLFGVEGDNYNLGSAVWLKDIPSQDLIDTFKSIGFSCSDETPEESCKKWELRETVTIEKLMKLEPYYKNFKQDDCRNCG